MSEVSTGNEREFYTVSEEYWKAQPATVDGMLGGFECVSPADIEQSQKFLSSFINVSIQASLDRIKMYSFIPFFYV